MALLPSEVFSRGFVLDSTTKLPVVVTSRTGATWQRGFLRDLDGRLVVQFV